MNLQQFLTIFVRIPIALAIAYLGKRTPYVDKVAYLIIILLACELIATLRKRD